MLDERLQSYVKGWLSVHSYDTQVVPALSKSDTAIDDICPSPTCSPCASPEVESGTAADVTLCDRDLIELVQFICTNSMVSAGVGWNKSHPAFRELLMQVTSLNTAESLNDIMMLVVREVAGKVKPTWVAEITTRLATPHADRPLQTLFRSSEPTLEAENFLKCRCFYIIDLVSILATGDAAVVWEMLTGSDRKRKALALHDACCEDDLIYHWATICQFATDQADAKVALSDDRLESFLFDKPSRPLDAADSQAIFEETFDGPQVAVGPAAVAAASEQVPVAEQLVAVQHPNDLEAAADGDFAEQAGDAEEEEESDDPGPESKTRSLAWRTLSAKFLSQHHPQALQETKAVAQSILAEAIDGSRVHLRKLFFKTGMTAGTKFF